MSGFRWTRKRERAALNLAQGYTVEKTAKEIGVTERTVYRWRRNLDFASEVDRLSLMIGIASRAERLRIAMQAVRQLVGEDGLLELKRGLLDWLKYSQSETDGAKLDLAVIFANMEAATENAIGEETETS